MKKTVISGFFLALLVIAIVIASCVWFVYKANESGDENPPSVEQPTKPEPPAENEAALNKFLPLGNPSNAVFNQSNPDNYLMTGEYFSLSYSRSKGIPNWVMWRLNKNSFGDSQRQNDFRPDTRLPDDWTKITPSDYLGSGYDRGHICPSADRSSSDGANSSTFLMTNMSPQKNDLNAGPWEKLESYSRSMARRNINLYIIAGNYGEKGKIKNKITIPTNFWKIVIAVPGGQNIGKDSRVIAVDMPNIDNIKEKNWRDYRTTIRQIEQKTGYNFLSVLSAEVQNVLETKVDSRQ
jgi:endonuclease G, mitochondrial